MNGERGEINLLTTHDLTDVEQPCRRMMMIDHKRPIDDGGIEEIRPHFGTYRTLMVDLEPPDDRLRVAPA